MPDHTTPEHSSDATPSAQRGTDGRWLTTADDGRHGTFPAHWPAPPAATDPEARAAWIATNAQRDQDNANPHATLARHALSELHLARYAELLAKRVDPTL